MTTVGRSLDVKRVAVGGFGGVVERFSANEVFVDLTIRAEILLVFELKNEREFDPASLWPVEDRVFS